MQRKRTGWIICLLVLMWMSITGQYLSIPELYDSAWWLGLIDVAVISVAMMIIPFIFRIVNKERLATKKGKKICKWNSIGMFILSVVLSVAILDGNGMMGIGGVGAVMFYFINKWMFVYDENIDPITSKEKTSIKIEVDEDELVKKSSKKNKFCKLCGGKIDGNNKCRKCGKQYFKFNKNIIMYIVIGILVITNLVTLIMYLDKNNETENIDEVCETNESWCETTMDILTKGQDWTYVSDKLDFYDENIVFVVEGYGDYYYTYDCVQEITDGEEYTYWAYNKDAAIYEGYKKGTCN